MRYVYLKNTGVKNRVKFDLTDYAPEAGELVPAALLTRGKEGTT